MNGASRSGGRTKREKVGKCASRSKAPEICFVAGVEIGNDGAVVALQVVLLVVAKVTLKKRRKLAHSDYKSVSCVLFHVLLPPKPLCLTRRAHAESITWPSGEKQT